MIRRLCVFCGSRTGRGEEYAAAARALGRLLAARRIGLVYGGGQIGLMGVVADAVLDAGGEVIGVIPGALDRLEVAHRGLTELRIVRTMHERKAVMAELSDGFAALPGGFGTLDELCEVLTWSQLGIHAKPVGLVNVAGYFDPLLALLERATREEFLSPQNRSLLLAEEDPAALLDRFASWVAPRTMQWLDRDDV